MHRNTASISGENRGRDIVNIRAYEREHVVQLLEHEPLCIHNDTHCCCFFKDILSIYFAWARTCSYCLNLNW